MLDHPNREGRLSGQPFRFDPATRRASIEARDPAFYLDPYPVFEAIRSETPQFYWEEYGLWCFLGAADLQALFRDKRFGREILHVATREELGIPETPERLKPFTDIDALSMLDREPPAHTRLRGLVNRAFVSRQVEKLRPRIAALAHDLIDRFASQGEVELIEAFATPIPVTVIAELLGVPVERAPDLLDWSHKMVAMYQFDRTRAVEDAAVAAAEAFVAFLKEIIAERRRAPADDLLTTLIAAEEAGERLTEDELIATCILLLNAGHEATVHAIGNGVKSILESGLGPSALFASEKTAEAVAEECLRFDPPLHFFSRYVLEDLDYAGLALKKGDRVGLLLGAANRDPARFADPARFDPSRPPATHFAFGGGIHFCVGAPLARLELEVALPILFERLPGLRIARPPLYRDSYHFHGLAALNVAW